VSVIHYLSGGITSYIAPK